MFDSHGDCRASPAWVSAYRNLTIHHSAAYPHPSSVSWSYLPGRFLPPGSWLRLLNRHLQPPISPVNSNHLLQSLWDEERGQATFLAAPAAALGQKSSLSLSSSPTVNSKSFATITVGRTNLSLYRHDFTVLISQSFQVLRPDMYE